MVVAILGRRRRHQRFFRAEGSAATGADGAAPLPVFRVFDQRRKILGEILEKFDDFFRLFHVDALRLLWGEKGGGGRFFRPCCRRSRCRRFRRRRVGIIGTVGAMTTLYATLRHDDRDVGRRRRRLLLLRSPFGRVGRRRDGILARDAAAQLLRQRLDLFVDDFVQLLDALGRRKAALTLSSTQVQVVSFIFDFCLIIFHFSWRSGGHGRVMV